jgi:tetraacyldisaccharide 4'-kinase
MVKPPSFWKNINIISIFLYPLSILYTIISKLRYILQKPEHHKSKVICIGNVAIGGSGKTPLAIALGKLLISQKYKIAYACKNYGGSIKHPTQITQYHTIGQVIDEALLLSKIAPTFIAANRNEAIREASELADIVISDDGLQNNSFHKDLSILALPRDKNFGNNLIFPAGPLRESLKDGLKKSGLVFIMNETKTSHKLNRIVAEKHINKKQIFQTSVIYKLCGPKRKKYIAFCGIANPSNFFESLEIQGIQPLKEITYPDHYQYTKKDLSKLLAKAQKSNAGLITTEKDLVKFNKQQLKKISYLKQTIEIKDKNLFINYAAHYLRSRI